MAGDRCTVSQMADVIMEGLEEYAQHAADDMKKAVKKAGTQARKDIQENAPVKTGAYAKSWAAKTKMYSQPDGRCDHGRTGRVCTACCG